MLTIPTYVAPSKIHGMGVFTAIDVSKGNVIWEFHPEVDQKFSQMDFVKMLNALPDEHSNRIESWSYYENGVYILCGDNAKFFNHEEENPSTFEKYGVMYTTANRDLKVGDELTCDYRNFDDPSKSVQGKLYA